MIRVKNWAFLTGSLSGLFFPVQHSAMARTVAECDEKCYPDYCNWNKDNCPEAYCERLDGKLPSWSRVTVDDIAPGETGWITLEMRWDKNPEFSSKRAVEFSVSIAMEDLYLEPVDGKDLNPEDHFSSDLPDAYRDVYNHTAGTPGDVYAGLKTYCPELDQAVQVDMPFATALWAGISAAQDKAHQFAVGTESPQDIKPYPERKDPYFFSYRVRRKEGGNTKDHGYAWITQDGVPNFFCPLITGDSLGTFFDSGDPKPPMLLNRLCVPTAPFEFSPRSGNTCGKDTVCEDCDNDDLFASQSFPMFGSNVGDPYDSNYDPALKQCVACYLGSCPSGEWCQPAFHSCEPCPATCSGLYIAECYAQCGSEPPPPCTPDCENKCGGVSDGCGGFCYGCPNAHNCENGSCVACGGQNEPCCDQSPDCFVDLTCQSGVCLPAATSSLGDVALGRAHTCAVTNGEVRCFGSNQNGQLGNGSTGNALTPSAVKGVGGSGTLSGIQSVAAGLGHSCALTVNKKVVCWGYNLIGQLGNGSTNQSTVPVQVLGPGGNGELSNIAEISAGDYFTCAMTQGSGVYCWGQIPFGSVGGVHTWPELLPGVTSAVEISAGRNHLCLRKADNSVWCVGENYYAQLGNGSSSVNDADSPVQVVGDLSIPLSSGGLPDTMGDGFSCSWDNTGSISCWGQASLFQIGRPGSETCEGGYSCEKRPQLVQGLSFASGGLAVGSNHACSLENGVVMCWGSGQNGQVGLNALQLCSSHPCSDHAVTVPQCGSGPALTASRVFAGGDHTCAVVNGNLMCWGLNNNGQLGNGTTNDSSCPVAVSGL